MISVQEMEGFFYLVTTNIQYSLPLLYPSVMPHIHVCMCNRSQGRIQDFKEGGSNTVMRAKQKKNKTKKQNKTKKKNLSHAHFSETTPIYVRFHGLLQLQISRSRSIDTKVSERMSPLASILILEGFLLAYFQCWSKPEMNSRQLGVGS